MVSYIFMGFVAVVLASFAQLILKFGANKMRGVSGIAYYLNWHTVLGYFLMFLATLVNLFVFSKLDLKFALFFFPFNHIVIFLFSVLILKEEFNRKSLLGYAFVLLGMFVFSL